MDTASECSGHTFSADLKFAFGRSLSSTSFLPSLQENSIRIDPASIICIARLHPVDLKLFIPLPLIVLISQPRQIMGRNGQPFLTLGKIYPLIAGFPVGTGIADFPPICVHFRIKFHKQAIWSHDVINQWFPICRMPGPSDLIPSLEFHGQFQSLFLKDIQQELVTRGGDIWKIHT